MNESERAQILNMLHDGKITVDEAQGLLSALDERAPAEQSVPALKDSRGRKPKKLRSAVDSSDPQEKAKVNLSIPLSLVRAFGPMIAKSIPADAKEQMGGVDIGDIINHIDELVAENQDQDIVNIDVDGSTHHGPQKVRIYFE